jgi:hypothetical protein
MSDGGRAGGRSDLKAPTGVEPVMEDLQSSALPLGYGAEQGQKLFPDNDLCNAPQGRSSSTPNPVSPIRHPSGANSGATLFAINALAPVAAILA